MPESQTLERKLHFDSWKKRPCGLQSKLAAERMLNAKLVKGPLLCYKGGFIKLGGHTCSGAASLVKPIADMCTNMRMPRCSAGSTANDSVSTWTSHHERCFQHIKN